MLMTKEKYNEKMNKCHIPESIDGKTIERKTVLGNQKIESIFVPYGIRNIGDWAFAHCMKLKEVWLPDTLEELGRDIFQDDKMLEKIYLYSKRKKASDKSALEDEYFVFEEAAGLVTFAVKCFEKSEYINNTLLIMQTNFETDSDNKFNDFKKKSWLNSFDEALLEYINEPDDTGFNPFLAGGEEDYEDPENDPEYFKMNKRIKKCGFILERLKFDENIKKQNDYDHSKIYGLYEGEDDSIKHFVEYMKANKEEAIRFIVEKKQESYGYLKIYAGYGLIEEEEITELLETFLDDDYIESKAYLIKYKEDNFGKKDVWDMFKI